MRHRLFLLALFSSAACSASSPSPRDDESSAAPSEIVDLDAFATASAPESEPAEIDAAALSRAAYLVWGVEPVVLDDDFDVITEDDVEPMPVPKTFALDRDGNVIATLDGAYVIAAGQTYRWDVEKVVVDRVPCAQLTGEVDDIEPEFREHLVAMAAEEKRELELQPTAEIDRASFVDVVTGARTVVATFGENDSLRDISFTAELTGSVGSVVFVREKTSGFACGAHGNYNSSARAIDLALGAEETDLGLDGDVITQAEKSVAPVFAERRAEWGGGGSLDDSWESDTHFVELVPEYSADGALVMQGRFATFAPFAFSDDWAGYGMTATTRLTKLPGKLASAHTAPEAVRTFLRAHPTFQLRGTSAR